MGTIMQRRKKDGATSYTAVIRKKKGGKVVLTLTETFKNETAAARWMRKTERALSEKGALDRAVAAQHGFVAAADTPQFFPSSVALIALLETLLSFVIAVASDEIVDRVETFHRRRHQLGIYEGEPE